VSGEEVLGLFGRFEPLHLPLSSSRRSMRVVGPIVQISALSVLDAVKQLTLSVGYRDNSHAGCCAAMRDRFCPAARYTRAKAAMDRRSSAGGGPANGERRPAGPL
jgi:hypothetical protein